MRKFILNICLFVLYSIFLTICIEIILIELIQKESNFKFKKQIKGLIVGHSHPSCSFNDSLITNYKNIAQSGESYFYSYPKLEQVLNQNKFIKIVFIEFTNNQINKEMNNWIFDDRHMPVNYPKYSAFMSFENHMYLLKNNPIVYLKSKRIDFIRKIRKILSNRFDYTLDNNLIGGYRNLDRNKTDSMIRKVNIKQFNSKIKKGISHKKITLLNVVILKKIIKMCIKKNIKVFLIRSPQHKYSEDKINEIQFQFILKKYLNKTEFLDFNNFPLKNSEYGDFGHLNYKGANIFSKWFNELLNLGLLKVQNKQEFINFHQKKYMELRKYK